MAEVCLHVARRGPLVDQVVTAAVSQHVRVDRDGRIARLAGAGEQLEECRPGQRSAAFVEEDPGLSLARAIVLEEFLEGRDFDPGEIVGAVSRSLQAFHENPLFGEVDLVAPSLTSSVTLRPCRKTIRIMVVAVPVRPRRPARAGAGQPALRSDA